MKSALPGFARSLLSAGHLVLDTAARTLTGPTGTCDLSVGAYAVLRALMKSPGVVLETNSLIAERWCPDLEPANAETSIRMAISRARDAISVVGGNPKQLRAVSGVGYRLDGAAWAVRAYAPGHVELLHRLIASHPDGDLVAEVIAADIVPPLAPSAQTPTPAGAIP